MGDLNRQELLEFLRGMEADHEPHGWPAVQMRQVSSLLDEVEHLERRRLELTEQCNEVYAQATSAAAALDTLKIENQALSKDAARYRFLRAAPTTDGEGITGICIDVWDQGSGLEVFGEEADLAVDSAMSKGCING